MTVQQNSSAFTHRSDQAALGSIDHAAGSVADAVASRLAIYTTDADGHETEGQVVVLDRGIGLGSGDPDRLFTAFYRTEAAQAQTAGLGIGLAACKLVAESLGGRIWASEREGGGSEFGFALPRS